MKKGLILGIVFILVISLTSAVVETNDLNCGNNICEKYEEVFDVGETDSVTLEGNSLEIKLVKKRTEQTENIWNVNGIEGGMSAIYNNYLHPIHNNFEFRVDLSDYSKYDVFDYIGEAAYLKEEQYCLLDCIGDADTDNIIKEFKMYPGWNLMNLEVFEVSTSNCDASHKDIICDEDALAIFIYVHGLNKYIDIKNTDEEDFTEEELQLIWESRTDLSSAFIYLKEEVSNKKLPIIIFKSQPNDFEPFSLQKGWNFISMIQQMREKTFNEIKGDCDIEKLHSFEPAFQEWSPNLVEDSHFMNQEKIDNAAVGHGLVIKVANDCIVGSKSSTSLPPTLP